MVKIKSGNYILTFLIGTLVLVLNSFNTGIQFCFVQDRERDRHKNVHLSETVDELRRFNTRRKLSAAVRSAAGVYGSWSGGTSEYGDYLMIKCCLLNSFVNKY